ncbi:hypothetical protein G9E11_06215 [Arthrobacter sp. IA7]|uniref:hypothetical protein n=1 Tax=Arthrobacter ipis TaxID=2716202 RepID=UPI0016873DA8|nr:hypothetical protein [Arthrobacter ipis]MBD1541849.1 hypothetical protein [Arthrobacter ipis]
MNTGISPALRRFFEQHIVADDPFPERSWLDLQDMPGVEDRARAAVAGLAVEPLSPLPSRHAGRGQHPQRLRRMLHHHNAATNHGDGI